MKTWQCLSCGITARGDDRTCPESTCRKSMHLHGWFGKYRCLCCRVEKETTDEDQRCCSECYGKMLEALAHDIDSSFDPNAENDYATVERILKRASLL